MRESIHALRCGLLCLQGTQSKRTQSRAGVYTRSCPGPQKQGGRERPQQRSKRGNELTP
ncbi:hypothetical protein GBAR_LOCUS13736, partial [Geodia barretti]